MSRGYQLDSGGDVVIQGGDLVLVDGDELLKQAVQTVLGTNRGEWFLDPEEGIDFGNILAKNPDYELIRAEILTGLSQVESTFVLESFEHWVEGRTLHIYFKAYTATGQIVEGGNEYGA